MKPSDSSDPEKLPQLFAILRWLGKWLLLIALVGAIVYGITGTVSAGDMAWGVLSLLLIRFVMARRPAD